MDHNEKINKMKKIQNNLLQYLEKENNAEEYYQQLIILFNDQDIFNDRSEFKSFLHLLNQITKCHYRTPNFFSKIDQILQYCKDFIKKTFTNSEIFLIFKNNKAILLSLVQTSILTIDIEIATKMLTPKYFKKNYHLFFSPEIQPFLYELKQIIDNQTEIKRKEDESYTINKKWQKEIMNLNIEYFEEKRMVRENDHFLCQIIRNDWIEQFIIYVNKNEISLKSSIDISIFETHSILMNKNITLIEYAAFFGSIQIFKYLYKNGVVLTATLWFYSIHGNHPEMIKILEDNIANQKDIFFEDCLNESIKCHHNDVTNYILNTFLNVDEFDDQNFDEDMLSYSFHYFNFNFFPCDLKNRFIFHYACKYDYIGIVKFFLKTKQVNLDEEIISK